MAVYENGLLFSLPPPPPPPTTPDLTTKEHPGRGHHLAATSTQVTCTAHRLWGVSPSTTHVSERSSITPPPGLKTRRHIHSHQHCNYRPAARKPATGVHIKAAPRAWRFAVHRESQHNAEWDPDNQAVFSTELRPIHADRYSPSLPLGCVSVSCVSHMKLT